LEQNLALAEKHVAQGERNLRRQRRAAANLEGDDRKRALETLRIFKNMQKVHLDNRDRLRRELGKAS
jgi:hypothetical protein